MKNAWEIMKEHRELEQEAARLETDLSLLSQFSGNYADAGKRMNELEEKLNQVVTQLWVLELLLAQTPVNMGEMVRVQVDLEKEEVVA